MSRARKRLDADLDSGEQADNATLIDRSRVRPELFAGIFDRHARVIHRYAARRLGDTLAEDIVGETFLVAFRRRDPAIVAVRTVDSAPHPEHVHRDDTADCKYVRTGPA